MCNGGIKLFVYLYGNELFALVESSHTRHTSVNWEVFAASPLWFESWPGLADSLELNFKTNQVILWAVEQNS